MTYAPGALGGQSHLLRFQRVTKVGQTIRCISSATARFKANSPKSWLSGDGFSTRSRKESQCEGRKRCFDEIAWRPLMRVRARRFLRWATPLPSREQRAVFLRGALVQRMLRRPQEQTLDHEIKHGGLAEEHSSVRCG